MKYLIYSDLHLEFGAFKPPADLNYDAVILAGDIGQGTDGMEWALSTFRLHIPIFYVAGNHEFYGGRDFILALAALRRYALNAHDAYFFEDTYIPEHNIAGATLWTDFRDDMGVELEVERSLNDFQGQIKRGAYNLSTQEVKAKHYRSKEFLRGAAQFSPDVIVTHHAPSYKSLNVELYGSPDLPIQAAFYSHMDDVVEEIAPKLWVHGHTHSSADYMIGETRVVCNPRGYAGYDENPDFDPALIVEI